VVEMILRRHGQRGGGGQHVLRVACEGGGAADVCGRCEAHEEGAVRELCFCAGPADDGGHEDADGVVGKEGGEGGGEEGELEEEGDARGGGVEEVGDEDVEKAFTLQVHCDEHCGLKASATAPS
jgi:hypothetical protein